MKWGQKNLEDFVRLWQSGATKGEIGKKFSVSISAVFAIAVRLRKNGVQLNPNRTRVRGTDIDYSALAATAQEVSNAGTDSKRG